MASQTEDKILSLNKQMNWLRFVVTFSLILLVCSTVLNVFLSRKVRELNSSLEYINSQGKLQVGADVSPIEDKDINGNSVSISYSNINQPTILYIFTPKCIWCARNLKNVKALANETKGNYRFVGLSLSKNNLKEYVAANSIDFVIYTDIPSSVVAAYKLGGTPQTIVISPSGKVVKNWFGAYQESIASEVESYFKIRLPGLEQVNQSNK
jgi:peroxiredoxin